MKAIIALGGGAERSKKRFDGALTLYLENPNSIIITSGWDWKEKDLQSYTSNVCKRLNLIPKIIEEHESKFTQENVFYSKQKIDELGKGIEEVDIIGAPSQAARIKRYFKRGFGKKYKLNFYAIPESLKITTKNFPYEIFKYLISLCPSYNDQILTMKLKKTIEPFLS